MGTCCSSDNPPATISLPPLKPVIGKRVRAQDYDIQKVIGDGASCKVWKATERSTGRKVAIKIYKNDTDTPQYIEEQKHMFEQEVAILQHIKGSPYLLEYVDAFEDSKDHSRNVVSRLCEGGELFDRITDTKVNWSERRASEVTRQMLLALDHLHSNNVAHRDLKPENYLFETPAADSRLRLIDFGCCVYGSDSTEIHDIAGSPYYVAPEALMKNSRPNFVLTVKNWKEADMWSIGVMIFLLVHGYPPFNGKQSKDILAKIKTGQYKFNPKRNLSNEVKDLISKLLVMTGSERLSVKEALKHPWIAQSDRVTDTPLPETVKSSLSEFGQMFKLRKAVARMFQAQTLSEADEKALQAVFKRFDTDGNGVLDEKEIHAMMQFIGQSDENAVSQLFKQMDTDGNATVSYAEFKDHYVATQMQTLSHDEHLKMFRTLDKDGNGFISTEELMSALRTVNENVAKSIIDEVDKDGNGQIDFNEWLAAMSTVKAQIVNT